MRPPNTLLTAAVLLALGLSACGSSEKTSFLTANPVTQPGVSIPRPTRATGLDPSFITRANAVCARAKAAIDSHGKFPYANFDPLHPDVKLLPNVGAFFASTQTIADRVPRELRDLGSPSRARGQWTELVAVATQSRAIADRQIAAAKASNVPAFVATVKAVHANETHLGQVGSRSGFNSASPCGAIL